MADIDYSNVVTSPVSLYGVAELLDIPDEPTDSKVCRCDNINPYSRKKPVRSSVITMPQDDASWKSLNWGYWIPDGASLENIAKWMLGVGNMPWTLPSEDDSVVLSECGGVWQYLKPRGKATYNEPFRLGDFRGYEHNTPRKDFFCGFFRFNEKEYAIPTDTTINVFSNSNKQIRFQMGRSLMDGTTGLYYPTEFSALIGMYFGIITAFTNGTSTQYKLLTSSAAITDNTNQIDLTDDKLEGLFKDKNCEYICLFVASPTAVTTPSMNRVDGIRVLPFNTFKVIRVNGLAYITTTGIAWKEGTKNVYVSVIFTNDGNANASNVSLTIDWGDGKTSTVYAPVGTVVSANGGTLTLTANHSYEGTTPSNISYTYKYVYGSTAYNMDELIYIIVNNERPRD